VFDIVNQDIILPKLYSMKYLLYLSFPLLCSACLRYSYTSPTHQLPNFTKKGQHEPRLGIHGPSSKCSAEAQYAWSFHKRMYVSGAGIYANSKHLDKDNGSSKHRYAELGLGTFLPLQVSTKIRWTLLLQSGIGLGRSHNNYAPYIDGFQNDRPKAFSQWSDVYMRFKKWYIQPGVRFRYRHLSASASLRMGQLIFTKGIFVNDRDDILDLLYYFKYNSIFWLKEPAISLHYDIKKVKIQLQFGGNYLPRRFALETFGSAGLSYIF
jgi:hypothetical protein